VNRRITDKTCTHIIFIFTGVAIERAWILSTMKVAATTAQATQPRLAFFQSEVLGLARSCDKLAATSSVVEKNIHHRRVVDLWSLFPCFCKAPSDIETAMPTLTASLSRALEDKRYPELLVRFFVESVFLTHHPHADHSIFATDGYLLWHYDVSQEYRRKWWF
jgi:hypothetical protein